MRVLAVHNRYQQRGGEDVIFEAETALLEAHGVAVCRLEFDNRAIPARRSLGANLRLAATTIRSAEGIARVGEAARRFRPDIVHFYNTFPLVSPAAYAPARATGAAIVQTVQNYRLICPAATFFRDGAVCEDCRGKLVPWPAIAHGCYRGSRGQSAVVAAMLTTHRLLGAWRHNVDIFLAATAFSRERLVAGGLPAERVLVKPNFLAGDPPRRVAAPTGFVFVGRLTVEKGIETLLRAWRRVATDEPLRVAGTGPLEGLVRTAAARDPRIDVRGHLDRAGTLTEMAGSRALIFPSLWYEGFPMTIVEAMAVGLPVIATRLGAMAEVVEDGVTGLLVPGGDDAALAERIGWALANPAALTEHGRRARERFEQRYTPERNIEHLLRVYAVARARRAGAARA